MDIVEKLKTQQTLSRSDIAELLASIGAPGESLQEKKDAVAQLNKQNFQLYKIEDTLSTYAEY